ncbi:MAG: glycosyltransferase [Planctomycetota bacterium]
MNNGKPHILYVGSVLPKRSETFVYREVLGLRQRGVRVSAASVNTPERGLGDPQLDQLADEAFHVYGRGIGGKLAVLRDSLLQAPLDVSLPQGIFEAGLGYWAKYFFQWNAGKALARRVRGQGITHVHAHMAHVPATVAMSCAASLGVPFSFTGHAADLFRDRTALKTKLRHAAFVSCISEWHRIFYRGLAPTLKDEQLPLIRCGVDMAEFTPAEPGASRGILAVGRLVPKKGFDVLIRALVAAPAEVTLQLVGDGPEEAELKALAAEAGVAERVEFLGAKSNNQVRELMGRAALFVLPCQKAADGDRDGIPVVLMEAMARNVCVVSGDLPTIRELVSDNVTGVMVPPGAVDELSGAIVRLLRDDALRRRLADAGRARVAGEFAQSVNLDRLEAALTRVASGSAHVTPVQKPVDPPPPPKMGAAHA